MSYLDYIVIIGVTCLIGLVVHYVEQAVGAIMEELRKIKELL